MNKNERIELSEYNPRWKISFQSERQVLEHKLSVFLPVIEHIGSTAIPNLIAKPIIDILIGIRDYPIPDCSIETMKSIGYEYHGEAGVSGRVYFTKRQEENNFNVHITLVNGDIWNNNILFRDYLLSNPDVATNYSELKRDIFNSGIVTLLEYSAQKADFILQALRKAKHSCSK